MLPKEKSNATPPGEPRPGRENERVMSPRDFYLNVVDVIEDLLRLVGRLFRRIPSSKGWGIAGFFMAWVGEAQMDTWGILLFIPGFILFIASFKDK